MDERDNGDGATARARREIEHGKKLSMGDAEATWGWSSPAGRLRAVRRAGLISQGAGLVPGVRVLEIGCGTGLFTEMFAASGAVVTAVDISEELLVQARARGIGNAHFLAKRFEECDVDGPFDAVIGSSVLHHLDMEPALSRIRALLAPGGVLCFAEPNMLNPQIAVQKNVPFVKRAMGDSPDETAFVRWRLRGVLARAGFDDIAITPFDWLHPATPAPLIGAVRALGRALEAIPLAREFAGSLVIRARRPAP